ncbi:hypothetical protein DPEC_G00360000 [Dallia pectoralis]|uniref:Uncharacterized protein n=1 Tax=Dallia pectoralis TaxID=75939 RepID=A0ACC2F0P3_DALPE|nr:hypothetical protein DPEC_G00360000 [Dallia pectoralis]
MSETSTSRVCYSAVRHPGSQRILNSLKPLWIPMMDSPAPTETRGIVPATGDRRCGQGTHLSVIARGTQSHISSLSAVTETQEGHFQGKPVRNGRMITERPGLDLPGVDGRRRHVSGDLDPISSPLECVTEA